MSDKLDAPASAPPQPLTELLFTQDPTTPRWIKDVFRFLPVKSQFILSGNIRDRYAFPADSGKHLPLTFRQYLVESLKLKGYDRFIVFNPVDGFVLATPRGESEADCTTFFKDKFKINFDAAGRFKCSFEKSLEIFEKMAGWKENFIAMLADFASRYAVRVDTLGEKEHEYFTRALVLSHEATPHTTPALPQAQFNPIFWICDKENDLPHWLMLDNPRIRPIVVPKPDHILRRALIIALTPSLEGYAAADEGQTKDCHDSFVEQTEGMSMTDVIAITQLCRREKLPFLEIGEAVRRYKLGVTEDPWKRLNREKIARGDEFIRKRVKGQQAAVIKALDIIKRAVTGLSGAQGSKVGGRPRGVMFLAGPTGTGKTELAKTLTELLFGDERAYIRFDMSEFSAEHADQRLIGAPPGYIGSDLGGELTNAIREKPFSVLLFDEIEKAHPRILDKFLQILDDGVLTSGRGERVYFSESVIIFTSNLGTYKLDEEGRRVPNVTSEQPYAEVERSIRAEIDSYFKIRIGRPEILNRIGENIVVFDFIRNDVASDIFEKMVGNVLARLADKQKIRIVLPDNVKQVLREYCLKDLSNGGRGVGNQIEAWLINPLGRALFDSNVTEGSTVNITGLEMLDGVPTVKLKLS
jgi:energy-coupling factor transporter ATP-binding protein EcfA2